MSKKGVACLRRGGERGLPIFSYGDASWLEKFMFELIQSDGAARRGRLNLGRCC